ncbi:MAG: polymerase subunit sigma-70 [Firmicutes bacterium]|nr:polymerase subunit sigma-70 [Bacillota bacterium]
MAVYARLTAEDNVGQIQGLRRNLAVALRQDITPRQRQFLLLYYSQGMNMREIAENLGVDRSTVSRTIKRGEERLRRCLRYGAANLLKDEH